MSRGHGLLQPPAQDISPAEGCRSCAIVQWAATQSGIEGAAYVAETADEDAVVLSGSLFAGLVVIPRHCISGLEELPPLPRAHVLAAVRRATVLVGQKNRGTTSRIVALIDSSTPAGHVSFQILSNGSDNPTSPATWSVPPP
jgi:hypothetical protein